MRYRVKLARAWRQRLHEALLTVHWVRTTQGECPCGPRAMCGEPRSASSITAVQLYRACSRALGVCDCTNRTMSVTCAWRGARAACRRCPRSIESARRGSNQSASIDVLHAVQSYSRAPLTDRCRRGAARCAITSMRTRGRPTRSRTSSRPSYRSRCPRPAVGHEHLGRRCAAFSAVVGLPVVDRSSPMASA